MFIDVRFRSICVHGEDEDAYVSGGGNMEKGVNEV